MNQRLVESLAHIILTLSQEERQLLDQELQISSRPRLPESESFFNDNGRQLLAKSLKGKYAHTSTSSDAFAQRKQDEIDWENRPR